jgi:hypothetical protein
VTWRIMGSEAGFTARRRARPFRFAWEPTFPVVAFPAPQPYSATHPQGAGVIRGAASLWMATLRGKVNVLNSMTCRQRTLGAAGGEVPLAGFLVGRTPE